MATRTLTGSRPVTNSPYLELDVTDTSQEIANNRTRVNLKLYLRVTHPISYTARYTGRLHGTSFTASGRSITSPGRYLLYELNTWVDHSSDGTKTQSFSASYNVSITWSGRWISSLSVSGSVSFPRIARKHTVSSARLASSLSPNTSNTLTVSGTAHYTGFYYWTGIYDGSTKVWDYGGYYTGTPFGNYNIPASTVNTMLNRMGSATSKVFRVRVWTYTGNGTGSLGESEANFTVNVSSSVTPSASGMSVSINGSGHDKTINKYVQNISRVTASFNASAGYGSSIASQSIVVRRVSGSSDSQTISGRSGTTSREVRSNGTYEAIGTVRDARGRTATSRTTFTVETYSPPNLGNTDVQRVSGNEKAANVAYSGTWSRIGGSNSASLRVERKLTTAADSTYTAIRTVSNNTTGSITGSMTDAVTSESFDYRFTITDQFSMRDTVVISLGTPRVLLAYNKDIGIGIGKYHEDGVLDVDGDVNLGGNITIKSSVYGDTGGSKVSLSSRDDNGHGYIQYIGGDGNRKGWVGISNSTTQRFDINLAESGYDIRLSTTGKIEIGSDEIVARGSNSNGEWVRLYDGTMIARGYANKTLTLNSTWGNLYYANFGRLTFPIAFQGVPYVAPINSSTSAVFMTTTANNSTTQTGNIDIYRPNSTASQSYSIGYIAIGRWK